MSDSTRGHLLHKWKNLESSISIISSYAAVFFGTVRALYYERRCINQPRRI